MYASYLWPLSSTQSSVAENVTTSVRSLYLPPPPLPPRRCLALCMDELGTNLGTVFLTRLATGNITEVALSILGVGLEGLGDDDIEALLDVFASLFQPSRTQSCVVYSDLSHANMRERCISSSF